MYKLFDAHSDLFEDVDEKRQRGLTQIIRTFHVGKWTAGGCIGGFCPIWVDPFCEVYSMPVEEQAQRILMHMNEELSECGDIACIVKDSSEYEAAVSSGRHAIITGTEGLSFLHGDWGKLDMLYDIGMREFSLTWNETNEFAGGAGGDPSTGLSSAGIKCVRKIRELGAILDLAHASKATFFDAVSIIDGPFMVSHGNIAHLYEHPRNLTDEQLRIVRDHNGVLGISAYAPFLSADPAKWTVATMCDNIEYAAEIAGIDHVGLGFDLVDFLDDVGTDASISDSVAGFESIACAQNIAKELEKRGFSEQDICKVFHDNYLRLIKCVTGDGSNVI